MYLGAYSVNQYVRHAGEPLGALAQVLITALWRVALGIGEARGPQRGAKVAGELQEVQGAILLLDEAVPELTNLPATHLWVHQEPAMGGRQEVSVGRESVWESKIQTQTGLAHEEI